MCVVFLRKILRDLLGTFPRASQGNAPRTDLSTLLISVFAKRRYANIYRRKDYKYDY